MEREKRRAAPRTTGGGAGKGDRKRPNGSRSRSTKPMAASALAPLTEVAP
jgi:hypothetical protein